MVSLKSVAAIAMRWHKMAGIAKRSRATALPTGIISQRADQSQIHQQPAHKGHFVVYSADERRFVVPLTYLNCGVFRELLKMSEEEFGLPSDGPITLPCDAVSMEYIVSVVKREVSTELENALLLSLAARDQCSQNPIVSERMISNSNHNPMITVSRC